MSDPSHPGSRVIQKFHDPTLIDLSAAAASHTFRLVPRAGEVLQVNAMTLHVIEAIGTATTPAVVTAKGREGGAVEADLATSGNLAAAAANAVVSPTFTPFYLDGDQGDYVYIDHKTAASGGTVTGTVYVTLHYEIIKQATPVSDNASNYFAA